MAKRYAQMRMPSIRTMQLWFKKKHLNKPRVKGESSSPTESVSEVHDCWQIDAKENVTLQDDSGNCYLTTVDVKSGAALETPVFPPQAD